ncbi:MAG: hypothetical protein HOU81_11305 [Hamadaea sp.]|uniref:hypothetical protein n=1 Tax=Hamadaea sp. TaxID=2024425 RepID=UPI00182CBF1C|nr:hypothetical protein [Hamadaea sp.]NUR71399.1 hypothetical protein [Hamadaea sp.]NUT22696.1 hypothetical protein [Hamadaea sp.]
MTLVLVAAGFAVLVGTGALGLADPLRKLVAACCAIGSGALSVLQLLTEPARKKVWRAVTDPKTVGPSLLVTVVVLAGSIAFTASRGDGGPKAGADASPSASLSLSPSPSPSPFPSPSLSRAPNPYGGPATMVLDERFTDPETSDWHEQDGHDQGCFFDNGYHVATTNYYYECHGYAEYANFTAEVTVAMTRGNGGAITFRDDNSGGQYYVVEFDARGEFTARKIYKGGNKILVEGKGKAGRTQTIAITAVGPAVTIYLGGVKVGSFRDEAIASGSIGLIAAGGKSSEIVVSRVRVWSDSQ